MLGYKVIAKCLETYYMIWAQKHFAYAHNIRYVMLCCCLMNGRCGVSWHRLRPGVYASNLAVSAVVRCCTAAEQPETENSASTLYSSVRVERK